MNNSLNYAKHNIMSVTSVNQDKRFMILGTGVYVGKKSLLRLLSWVYLPMSISIPGTEERKNKNRQPL
jgi:hypothetical protein